MPISIRIWAILFVITTCSIAVLFWFYLNIQASMHIKAQHASVRLPDALPTKISIGNHLQTHAQGKLDTEIKINRGLDLPLQGKYRANLQFAVVVPVSVNVDYKTTIKVDQIMSLETSTNLIYQNKLLPTFPLKMDVPIRLDLPFQLKQNYRIPIRILFDGPVFLGFDESLHLQVKHDFKPQLEMNDPMTMRKITTFHATMRNIERNTKANLEMHMQLPLKQIHP